MRPVLDASPSLDFSAHFQLLNLRPYKRLEEKRQYSGDVLVLQRSTLSKAPCKRPQHCWMLHDASVCTPCCMLLRVVGSYWNRSAYWTNNFQNFFCSVITKRSTTILDSFAQLFQHCWGHEPALHMVSKVFWVVSFPRCTAGPNIAGSCWIRLPTTTNTDATTSNIVGPTMLRVIPSVCT